MVCRIEQEEGGRRLLIFRSFRPKFSKNMGNGSRSNVNRYRLIVDDKRTSANRRYTILVSELHKDVSKMNYTPIIVPFRSSWHQVAFHYLRFSLELDSPVFDKRFRTQFAVALHNSIVRTNSL